jgi:hypothetical protein
VGRKNGVPYIDTPEAVTVIWPTIPGKRYRLFVSADLSQGSWIGVPNSDFISNGNIPEFHFTTAESDKLFWRVTVEDIDWDGDGLNDYEEHKFGTNPTRPMTFPGIPDAWLAANFPSGQGFDPDGDPDGDGIANARENQLGLDPNSHDPTGLANPDFNEEITDEPTLNFREEYPSDPYEQNSVEGWLADIGGHIEIWDIDDGNPYVELQSHLEAHGVKQEFDMLPGSRLCFILRYKGRYEFDAYDNAFKVEVEGAEEMLINGNPATVSGDVRRHSFMEDDEWEKYSDWHYASVSITAPPGNSGLKPLTLTLTPLTIKTYGEDEEEDITYGGFVDIIPVEAVDNEFATGVDDISITSNFEDTGHQDKYWIMAPSGNDPNDSPCSNEMKFKIPADAATEMEIAYPDGTDAPATAAPDTFTLAPAGADCAWHGESATTTETPAVIWKIGTLGQTKNTVNLPIAVKTMKRRTVRVAVWPVNRSGMPPLFPDQAARDSFEADLNQRLDQIFAYQMNAWFELNLKTNQTADYLDGTYTAGSYTIRHGVKEKAMISAHREAAVDINLYLIGNVSYLSGEPDSPYFRVLSGSSYPSQLPSSGIYKNCAVVNLSALYSDDLQTAAHEIGHLLLGPGHPNQYRTDDPLSGGPAPLQSLLGEHSKRLMHSLSGAGRLLVKGEWDEAEMWLRGRPNGDN